MASNGTGAIPIDGDRVPAGDGSTDPNGITRDLEIVLEEEIRALVDLEQLREGRGRRYAYALVIARLRELRLAIEKEIAT